MGSKTERVGWWKDCLHVYLDYFKMLKIKALKSDWNKEDKNSWETNVIYNILDLPKSLGVFCKMVQVVLSCL